MREIKFRAWIIEGKYWLSDYYYRQLCGGDLMDMGEDENGDGDLEDYVTTIAEDKEYILEQYIGLKDKNGREIYEGDIIQTTISHEGHSLPHRGEVVFDADYASFGTRNDAGVTLACHHAINNREVIGNIHENPELLA